MSHNAEVVAKYYLKFTKIEVKTKKFSVLPLGWCRQSVVIFQHYCTVISLLTPGGSACSHQSVADEEI